MKKICRGIFWKTIVDIHIYSYVHISYSAKNPTHCVIQYIKNQNALLKKKNQAKI